MEEVICESEGQKLFLFKVETKDLIISLFKNLGLGEVSTPIENVSGGFMHRMYKVTVGGTGMAGNEAGGKSFAVKHLNPEIMKRPRVFANYERAERLEGVLEKAGIPIVPALCFDGKKMQELGGNYFYIFDWHNANVTDWNNISEEQCCLAGNTLGRIHALDFDSEQTDVSGNKPELSKID